MRRKAARLAVLAAVAGVGIAPPAAAGESCAHAVVFTLPGITWSEVLRVEPPNLIEAVGRGATGSMSVRTIESATTYQSGFATIGAGARLDGGVTTGSELDPGTEVRGPLRRDVRVASVGEIDALAGAGGFAAVPGALAASLDAPVAAIGNGDNGRPPPIPAGFDRWALLAAMDRRGSVDLAATEPDLLERAPEAPFGVRDDPEAMRNALRAVLARPCSTAMVAPGDLVRADAAALTSADGLPGVREAALLAADDLLGFAMDSLSPRDLLLIASPTSPAWEARQHLGVAVAVGPGFEPGAVLSSASTRRAGVVTLPDVAPTLLQAQGREAPAAMTGAAFFEGPSSGDRIAAAAAFDEESVLVEEAKVPIWTGFVLLQLAVYALVFARRTPAARARGITALVALAVASFPLATFLVGLLGARTVGLVAYVALTVASALLLAGAATVAIASPGIRLLVVSGLTITVLLVDIASGARLQINTVFGYSPIVAGRFAGAGNIAFAVVAGSCVATAGLLVERWDRRRAALTCAAVLFAAAVLIEGAPQFGSDIGGVLALVPGLAVTWLWLSGRPVNWRLVIAGAVGALVVLGLFLAFDLARPPDARTHLASLFTDVRSQGADYLLSTIVRKARANLRVLTSSVWTLLVAPGIVVLILLVYKGRDALKERLPTCAATIGGGLVVAALGFALNDSGVVVPAVMLAFLVPLALIERLELEARGP